MYYTAYTESLNTLNPKLILALAHVVGYLARALATLKRLKAGELTRERLASCAARRPIEQLAYSSKNVHGILCAPWQLQGAGHQGC